MATVRKAGGICWCLLNVYCGARKPLTISARRAIEPKNHRANGSARCANATAPGGQIGERGGGGYRGNFIQLVHEISFANMAWARAGVAHVNATKFCV